jgi:hypothetical protein
MLCDLNEVIKPGGIGQPRWYFVGLANVSPCHDLTGPGKFLKFKELCYLQESNDNSIFET